MSKVLSYLDCGCAIMEDGSRSWCPTCSSPIPVDHLREAAPDLLKALKELLAVSWGSNSDKKGAEKRAEKAIAKAESHD